VPRALRMRAGCICVEVCLIAEGQGKLQVSRLQLKVRQGFVIGPALTVS
jgi:hypothetical protein